MKPGGFSCADKKTSNNGSWREIEARREKAALTALLAEVWDDDFDLDEEILAEMDHTTGYFTPQTEGDDDFDEDSDVDEFFDAEGVQAVAHRKIIRLKKDFPVD